MQTIDGRFPPAMGPAAYKTYQIAVPLKTHWTPATCRQVECDAYLHGWTCLVDEGTQLGQRQAHYIRRESRRRFTEERNEAGLTVFTFEAGQEGFAGRGPDGTDHSRHRVRNMRPERFVERGGDWRGNPRGDVRVHRGPADWQESFEEHQGRLAERIARG